MRRSAEGAQMRAIVGFILLAALLAGCSDIYYDRREPLSFGAGDAPAANAIAQTIDPWPAAASDRNINTNGERMQRAQERYRTNKTTPLNTTNTSSVNFTPGQNAPATPNTTP